MNCYFQQKRPKLVKTKQGLMSLPLIQIPSSSPPTQRTNKTSHSTSPPTLNSRPIYIWTHQAWHLQAPIPSDQLFTTLPISRMSYSPRKAREPRNVDLGGWELYQVNKRVLGDCIIFETRCWPIIGSLPTQMRQKPTKQLCDIGNSQSPGLLREEIWTPSQ